MHNRAMATRTRRPRPIALGGLRGFEASARLLSFTLAAGELNLTQSSISRQIRTLETQVGKPLFKRRIRGLELTDAGLRLQRVVQASLSDIDRTIDDLRKPLRRQRVAVTTWASFASLMLVPRLARFSDLHPGIDIRIDAVDEVRNLERDGIDLAVRYAAHEHVPRDAQLLEDDVMIPVISPALLARVGPIERPADLARTTFIFQDHALPYDAWQSWTAWFDSLGEPMPEDVPTISLNFTDQAVEAALRGHGVMLAPVTYVREQLRRGDLVSPLPHVLPTPYGYYLLRNRRTASLPHVVAFADWLVASMGAGPADDAPGRRDRGARPE